VELDNVDMEITDGLALELLLAALSFWISGKREMATMQ